MTTSHVQAVVAEMRERAGDAQFTPWPVMATDLRAWADRLASAQSAGAGLTLRESASIADIEAQMSRNHTLDNHYEEVSILLAAVRRLGARGVDEADLRKLAREMQIAADAVADMGMSGMRGKAYVDGWANRIIAALARPEGGK